MSQIADDGRQVQRFVDVGTELPSAPKRGHIYFLVGDTNKIYACFVDNTWIEIASSTGGSPTNPAGIDTQVQFNDGGAFGADTAFTFDKAAGYAKGSLISVQNSAPADNDIAASQFILWLDDTNGAGALNIKAKTANGTVVTGTVALT